MLLVALLGCASGWIDQEPACDANPYEWADDLLTHILNGDEEGGFDYDPVDTPRAGISGSYDVSSGDFAWDVSYVQESYLVSQAVVGDGTVYHNGDLDLEAVITTTDVLDNVGITSSRFIREGCGSSSWSWGEDQTADDAIEITGVYKAEVYVWTAADDTWSYDGSLTSDLTETSHYLALDDSFEQTNVSFPDGTATQDIVGDESCSDGYGCDGHWDFAIDGSYTFSYDLLDGQDVYCTVTGEYDYAGDGTGHYDCDDYQCDLETVDGACTYSCDNGQKGDC